MRCYFRRISLLLFCCLFSWIVSYRGCFAAVTYSTSAAHSINNDTPGLDYKLTKEEQEEIIKLLRFSYLSTVDLDESEKYVNSVNERYTDFSGSPETMAAKSWLIDHNILERKHVLQYDGVLFQSASYENARKSWNQQFEDKYQEYYRKSPKTQEEAVKTFNSYVNSVLSSDVFTELQEIGELTKSGTEGIIKKFKNMKKKFKQAAEVHSEDGSEVYRDYLSMLYDEVKGYKPSVCENDDDTVTKTELMLLLCKAAYGVESSRPVVFNKESVRNGLTYSSSTPDYWNDGVVVSGLSGYWDALGYYGNASFRYGDFYYYVTGNVYETYLKTLLDKGIISEEEFNSSKAARSFIDDYDNFSNTNPVWYDGLGLCSPEVGGLGSAFECTEDGISAKSVRFFSRERLSRMEVYQYLEDVMHTSEEEMTKTEADIIAYKYGLKYLAPYNGSQLNTLKFLIAKGMLNFEDSSCFTGLDEDMDFGELYGLLYRLANKEARYRFNSIILTDSDNYWMLKGYAENDVDVIGLNGSFVMDDGTATVEEDIEVASVESNVVNGMLRFLGVQQALAENKQFSVVFKVSAEGKIKWTYDGTEVSKKNIGQNGLVGVEEGSITYAGKKVPILKITLEVQASTASKALKIAAARLTIKGTSNNSVHTVTKVKSVGNNPEEYTMISQNALREEFSDVAIIADKVLINTKTNSCATLLSDNHLAMVGNTIVMSDGPMVEETQDGVYYNLKLIVSLLDDKFMRNIGSSLKILNCNNSLQTYYVPVKNEYNVTGNATCTDFKVTNKMMKCIGGDPTPYSKGDYFNCYKVDDISEGLNTMVRRFDINDGGKRVTLYLVVDWMFAIPEVGEFAMNSSLLEEFTDIGENPTQAKVVKKLYTRPTESKILQHWWDSNYSANNAIVNFMLGETGKDFVTSGYLAPSVTILGPNEKEFKENQGKWLNLMFKGFRPCVYNGKTTGNENTIALYFGGGSSGNSFNEWWNYFFRSNEAFGLIDGISKNQLTMLERLAGHYRNFSVITGVQEEKYGGFAYGCDFFITNAGIVYRNVDVDSRVDAVISGNAKRSVKSIKVGTRTAVMESPVPEKTVVTYEGKHFLYRGTDKDGGYYKLTPLDNAAVKKINDPLYNGGYLCVTNNGDVDFVLDRIIASVSGESSRFDGWKSMYNNWYKTYLGEEGAVPDDKDFSQIFNYSASCIDSAKSLKTVFTWNDTFINYGNGQAVKSLKSIASSGLESWKDDIEKKRKLMSDLSNMMVKQDASLTWDLRNFNSGFNYGDNAFVGTSSSVPKDSKDSKGKRLLVGNRVGYPTYSDDRGIAQNTRYSFFEEGTSTVDSNYFVWAVPTLFVPMDSWMVVSDDSGKFSLSKESAVAALCFGNFYYSSIMSSIQNSVLADYVGSTKLGSMPKGSTITIAGIRFFKDFAPEESENGVWLTSVCMNATGKRSALRDSAAAYGATKVKLNQNPYKQGVLDLFKDTMIYCDNVAYPLTNYVLGKRKTGSNSGIQVGGLLKKISTNKHGIIYYDRDRMWTYKKGQSRVVKNHKPLVDCKYFRIRVKLDSSLNIRPLNVNKSMYALTSTTVVGNVGEGDDLPFFFGENLNFDSEMQVDVAVSEGRFNPSEMFISVKKDFSDLFAKAFTGDLRTLFLMFVCVVSVYLIVMSWVAYLVLHYGVLQAIFGALKPSIDVVKIFTLGLYGVDDDPPLYRIVILQFVLAIIASIALKAV